MQAGRQIDNVCMFILSLITGIMSSKNISTFAPTQTNNYNYAASNDCASRLLPQLWAHLVRPAHGSMCNEKFRSLRPTHKVSWKESVQTCWHDVLPRRRWWLLKDDLRGQEESMRVLQVISALQGQPRKLRRRLTSYRRQLISEAWKCCI